MNDATRIETPEVERQDLYVGVIYGTVCHGKPLRLTTEALDTAAELVSDYPHAEHFRIPGTRREKLTKALMQELQKWKAHPCKFTSEQLDAAYDALLNLDAEGVKG